MMPETNDGEHSTTRTYSKAGNVFRKAHSHPIKKRSTRSIFPIRTPFSSWISTLSAGLISLNKVSKIIAFALLSLLPVAFAGDNGDDFSNNLFSDLAPLMALFGEEVTKQFISQSMGWADNFLIAMAPLGILTVMVSAIRIGGHQWLKNIIGRARESAGLAEAELMSSTSSDVCELWVGKRGVARVLGSPDLVELIYEVDKNGKPKTNRIYSLQEAIKAGVIHQSFPKIPDQRGSSSGRIKAFTGARMETFKVGMNYFIPQKSSKKLSSLKNPPPNLVLNVYGVGVGEWELWFYAIIGILLQIGVLIWCVMAVKHMKYLKGGARVKDYALPSTIIGTLLVCTGVSICSHVVEASTNEYIYGKEHDSRITPIRRRDLKDEDKEPVQVVFLQRGGQIVSDQLFEGYAIFDDRWRPEIKISRKNPDGFGDIVIVGTILTVSGFILQFIGLRAMHWSCTIAQLVATLTMTALRASARRSLSSLVEATSIKDGMEVQWLAKELSGCSMWAVETGFVDFRKCTPGPPDSPVETAVSFLMQLHALTNWERPSEKLAISTGRAMEKIMNTLYNDKEGIALKGSASEISELECILPIKSEGNYNTISLKMHRTKNTNTEYWGPWFADTEKLEAILSLWMLSQDETELDLEIATIAVQEYRKGFKKGFRFSLNEKTNMDEYLDQARGMALFRKDEFVLHRRERQERFFYLLLEPNGNYTEVPDGSDGCTQVLGAWEEKLEEDYVTWLEIRKHGDLGPVIRSEGISKGSATDDVVRLRGTGLNPARNDLRYRYFGFEFDDFGDEGEEDDDDEEEREAEGEKEEETETEAEVFEAVEQVVGQEANPSTRWAERPDSRNLEVRFFLLSKTNTPPRDMLGLDLVSKFMWQAVKQIDAIHGNTRRRMINLKYDGKALINSVLEDLAQAIVKAGLGDLQDAYNVIIPPLSAAGKLPEVPKEIWLKKGGKKEYFEA